MNKIRSYQFTITSNNSQEQLQYKVTEEDELVYEVPAMESEKEEDEGRQSLLFWKVLSYRSLIRRGAKPWDR